MSYLQDVEDVKTAAVSYRAARPKQTTLDVDKLMKMTRGSRRCCIAALRSLDADGVADFFAGRHGYPTRIEWRTTPQITSLDPVPFVKPDEIGMAPSTVNTGLEPLAEFIAVRRREIAAQSGRPEEAISITISY